jgi:hypothetical protein
MVTRHLLTVIVLSISWEPRSGVDALAFDLMRELR